MNRPVFRRALGFQRPSGSQREIFGPVITVQPFDDEDGDFLDDLDDDLDLTGNVDFDELDGFEDGFDFEDDDDGFDDDYEDDEDR